MNIIAKLTFRHLKSNLKRTVVTLIGIIISVAMVAAVFTSAISFVNFMKETSIVYGGNWHTSYESVSLENVKPLKEDKNIEQYGYGADIAELNIRPDTQSGRAYTTLKAMDENYMDIFGIKLAEGRMPQNTSEIVVRRDFIKDNDLKWKVGDKVTIPTINYANNTTGDYVDTQYTICGITDTENSSTNYNKIICGVDDTLPDGTVNIIVRYDKLDRHIWDKIDATTKLIGAEKPATNYDLFVYAGVSNDEGLNVALSGFVAIILLLIVAASVFMIYDSFAVSYQQRAKYLGMLASVGATKSQKRNSIYYESLLLGAIGIPVGLLAGIGGIAITFKAIGPKLVEAVSYSSTQELPITVHVNWMVVLGTVIISAVTIMVSAYIPARRASKTTAIDAIRQTNTVKVKNSKKLRTSRLTEKLFGCEGSLAAKNFKRNGKRSRNIVFALSMSIVLFLSVANFSGIFTGMINTNYDSYPTNVYISLNSKDDAKVVEQQLNKMPNVKDYRGTAICYNITFDKSKEYLSSEASEYKDLLAEDSMVAVCLDNKSFDEYAAELGTDASKYHNASKPAAILYNTAELNNIDDKKSKTVEMYQDLTGKTISGFFPGSYDEQNNPINKDWSVKIENQTTAAPKSGNFDQFYNRVILVMPYDTFFTVFDDGVGAMSYGVITEDHKEVMETLDETLNDIGIGFSLNDLTENANRISAIVTVANVFGYGFIILITLISVTNIINTISTSMEERRREFAMIKSVGMTPKSFKKSIYLESIYYGLKSIFWGILISFVIDYLMYLTLAQSLDYGYTFRWQYYLIAVVAIFLIIGFALVYSMSKIKNDNIIETLKQDEI